MKTRKVKIDRKAAAAKVPQPLRNGAISAAKLAAAKAVATRTTEPAEASDQLERARQIRGE